MPSLEESRLFCFAQRQVAYAKWPFLLPALMSVCLAILFAWSAPFAATLRDDNYATGQFAVKVFPVLKIPAQFKSTDPRAEFSLQIT